MVSKHNTRLNARDVFEFHPGKKRSRGGYRGNAPLADEVERLGRKLTFSDLVTATSPGPRRDADRLTPSTADVPCPADEVSAAEIIRALLDMEGVSSRSNLYSSATAHCALRYSGSLLPGF
jgi:hypothetical protein